jgi:flagellar biosynthesis/type III secretory pathway protein FliH
VRRRGWGRKERMNEQMKEGRKEGRKEERKEGKKPSGKTQSYSQMVFIEKLKYQERSKMATRVQKHMV